MSPKLVTQSQVHKSFQVWNEIRTLQNPILKSTSLPFAFMMESIGKYDWVLWNNRSAAAISMNASSERHST